MRSTLALRPRPCITGMPSRMIEPLRLSPKPRVITESWVLPRVLPWVMPLTLASASSRLRGAWSRMTWAGITLTVWGISWSKAEERITELVGGGW
ncbi:hypothetical protein D3C85_1125780 [compost metagenome]